MQSCAQLCAISLRIDAILSKDAIVCTAVCDFTSNAIVLTVLCELQKVGLYRDFELRNALLLLSVE